MAGTGVAQTVWAIVWCRTKCPNVTRNGRRCTCRGHWPIRPAQRQKQKARGTSRPDVLEVIQNGIAHLRGQGKFLRALVLQTSDAKFLMGPVQVIESQPTNLADPQSVDRHKQNDCTLANMGLGVPC